MDSPSESLSWEAVSDGIKLYLGSSPHTDGLLNYLQSFLGLERPRSPTSTTSDFDSSISAGPSAASRPDSAMAPSPTYSDPTLKLLIERKRSADRKALKCPTPENRKRANALQRQVRSYLPNLTVANNPQLGFPSAPSGPPPPPTNTMSRIPSTAPPTLTRAPTATLQLPDPDELEIFLSKFEAASSAGERLMAFYEHSELVRSLQTVHRSRRLAPPAPPAPASAPVPTLTRAPTATLQLPDPDELEIFLSKFEAASSAGERLMAFYEHSELVRSFQTVHRSRRLAPPGPPAPASAPVPTLTRAPTATLQLPDPDELEIFLSKFEAASSAGERLMAFYEHSELVRSLQTAHYTRCSAPPAPSAPTRPPTRVPTARPRQTGSKNRRP